MTTRVKPKSLSSRFQWPFSGLFSQKPPRRELPLKLMVTLCPSFPHFAEFAADTRLAGIRLNSAKLIGPELDTELAIVQKTDVKVPLYFDLKGRQMRIAEVLSDQSS